jgi:hypothetical protein
MCWTISDGRGAASVCFSNSTRVGTPSNGNRPVSAWNSTTPSAYQSAAAVSCTSPAHCSGAMYATVPTIMPSPRWRRSRSATSPKSSSTTRPSLVTWMFDGLTSRWILPAACSACSPSASWGSAARRRSTSHGVGRGELSVIASSLAGAVGAAVGITIGSGVIVVVTSSAGSPTLRPHRWVSRSPPSSSSIVKKHESAATTRS